MGELGREEVEVGTEPMIETAEEVVVDEAEKQAVYNAEDYEVETECCEEVCETSRVDGDECPPPSEVKLVTFINH